MTKKPADKKPAAKKAVKKPAKAAIAETAAPTPVPQPAPQPAPATAPATPPATGYIQLLPGDPAPWFLQRSGSNPRYVFDTAAGRWILLCFFGSAKDPAARAALDALQANRDIFDDNHASFFGVSVD